MDNSGNKIPEGWVYSTLGDVCSQPQYGYTTKASNNGDLHLLRTTDITSGKLSWGKVPYCSENPVDPEKYLLEDGDIVISRAGSVGVSCLLHKPEKSVFASYLIRFKPFIDRKFFKYFLDGPLYWNAISENRLGIAVPNVNANKLKTISLPVPPLNEQHRIVAKIEALFSELDKGVESLKTAREQLKVYRQAVLKHAFEGKLTVQWREENKDKLKLAGSISGNNRQGQRQPTESVDIPEVWGWSIVKDILLEDPCNGRSVKDRTDGFPVLRLTALKNGRIDLAERKHGDWNREAALPFIVKPGDFLLSRGNGSKHLVGRGGVVPEHKDDVAFPDTMVRLRVDPSVIHIDFFRLLWESQVVRNQIELAARTTAGIYKINQNHIQSFWIPIPGVDEQRTIVALLEEKLSVVEELEQDLDKRLAASESLRQSILKKAFSGQLVPQDPNDEPAPVLLERIKAEKAQQIGSRSARNGTRKTRSVHKEVN